MRLESLNDPHLLSKAVVNSTLMKHENVYIRFVRMQQQPLISFTAQVCSASPTRAYPSSSFLFFSPRIESFPHSMTHLSQSLSYGESPIEIDGVLESSRERGKYAVCVHCGSPHNLLLCGNCRLVRYCSTYVSSSCTSLHLINTLQRQCQEEDWPTHILDCPLFRFKAQRIRRERRRRAYDAV